MGLGRARLPAIWDRGEASLEFKVRAPEHPASTLWNRMSPEHITWLKIMVGHSAPRTSVE